MLRDGTLEEQARVLKLAMPRDAIALDIAANQAFHNSRGEFDPALFRRLLAENGIDEQAFLAGEMSARARRAIADTVSGEFAAPETLVEAVVRHGMEERDAKYFVITGNEVRNRRAIRERAAGVLRQEPAAVHHSRLPLPGTPHSAGFRSGPRK